MQLNPIDSLAPTFDPSNAVSVIIASSSSSSSSPLPPPQQQQQLLMVFLLLLLLLLVMFLLVLVIGRCFKLSMILCFRCFVVFVIVVRRERGRGGWVAIGMEAYEKLFRRWWRWWWGRKRDLETKAALLLRPWGDSARYLRGPRLRHLDVLPAATSAHAATSTISKA